MTKRQPSVLAVAAQALTNLEIQHHEREEAMQRTLGAVWHVATEALAGTSEELLDTDLAAALRRILRMVGQIIEERP